MSNYIYKCSHCGKEFSSDQNYTCCPYCKSSDIKQVSSKRSYKDHKSKSPIVIILIILLVSVGCILLLKRNEIDQSLHPSEIKLSQNTEELLNYNYKDVVPVFEKAGFKSVQTKIDRDLNDDSGFPAVIGEVELITIDGNDNCKKGEWVSQNAKVVITYHDLKESPKPSASTSTAPVDIKVTQSSKEMKNQQYLEIQKKLKKDGFTNILLEPDADLKYDLLHKNGAVESVSIQGNVSFKKGDTFPSNSTIRIKYHTFKTSDEQPTSSPDPDSIKVPESAKSYKKRDYHEVEELLGDAGFTNIVTKADKDLKVGWLSKKDTVKSISINGKDKFEAKDFFPKDAKIVIVYHDFQSKDKENPIDKIKKTFKKKSK